MLGKFTARLPIVSRTLASLTIVWSLVAGTANSAEAPLRWKFAAGQKLRVEWTQEVETETMIGGKPLRLAVDTTFEQDWGVDSVDEEGTATITQSFRRIAVRMDMPPAAPLEYDSAAMRRATGDARPIAESLAPLIGPTWNAKITARGEVREVEASADLQAALDKVAAEGRLKSLFTGAGGADYLRQSLVVLPEQTLKVDESWEVATDADSPVGRVKSRTTYTYRGTERHGDRTLDALAATGNLEWTPARGGVAVGRQIKEQSQTGTVLFDATAGRLVESRQTQMLRTESRVRDTPLETRLTSNLKLKISVSAD